MVSQETRYARIPHSEYPQVHPSSLCGGEPVESQSNSTNETVHPSTDKPETTAIPNYPVWVSLGIVVCFCILGILLLPFILSPYAPALLSESELEELSHPGLESGPKAIPPPPQYNFAWPAKITHINQKLQNVVYGSGPQVFISVQDSTIVQFPIPTLGACTCALNWTPPPENDLEIDGDVSEIEAWSIIASHAAIHSSSSNTSSSTSLADIDFDKLSWGTRPVRGELLGTLDLTAHPNATTIEFLCPTDTDTLTVEFRCLRALCHVRFKQVHRMGEYTLSLGLSLGGDSLSSRDFGEALSFRVIDNAKSTPESEEGSDAGGWYKSSGTKSVPRDVGL